MGVTNRLNKCKVGSASSIEEILETGFEVSFTEADFSIDVDQLADVTVLTIRGELDLATAPRVTGQCSELAERHQTKVVIDASEITFIDAAGIRALIEGRSTILKHGTSFSLVPSRHVLRLLDLLDLHALFPSYSSTAKAVATVASAQTQENR